MIEKILEQQFVEMYQKSPLLVSAPGRVNLIGEHTDYNEGFVLPGAIDKIIAVAVAVNNTNTINVYGSQYRESISFSLNNSQPSKGWINYILGVTYHIQKRGATIKAVDVVVDGDVPVGAGMSSSAALCSAYGFALNELFQLGLSKMDLAFIGQKTEHTFVGAKVGIMDQFASLHGKAGNLMKLDCRSLEFEYIPFNFPGYKIVLVNSMVKHTIAATQYNLRRKQCEEGVSIMKQFIQGQVKSLRDVPLNELESHRKDLGEELYMRCRYVATENMRLQDGCELLKNGDLEGFGKLMYQTHEGLSKQYMVSCPELDFLVEESKKIPGVVGARMMGGGFGGCSINIVRNDAIDSFISEMKKSYEEKFSKNPEVYITQIEDGAKIIKR